MVIFVIKSFEQPTAEWINIKDLRFKEKETETLTKSATLILDCTDLTLEVYNLSNFFLFKKFKM